LRVQSNEEPELEASEVAVGLGDAITLVGAPNPPEPLLGVGFINVAVTVVEAVAIAVGEVTTALVVITTGEGDGMAAVVITGNTAGDTGAGVDDGPGATATEDCARAPATSNEDMNIISSVNCRVWTSKQGPSAGLLRVSSLKLDLNSHPRQTQPFTSPRSVVSFY
jgi:hypothetical protein